MKNYNFPRQNASPIYLEERDILGQVKPGGITRLKGFRFRTQKAPDLKVTYAGIGSRVIATFFDMIIVMSVLTIIDAFLFKFNFADDDFNTYRFFIVIFSWIFYNAAFECSVYQATFGELILKLKVVDLYGKRMSAFRSLMRCIVTIISILPIGLGIWYITTDPKKRAWHDLIAGTYVIKG